MRKEVNIFKGLRLSKTDDGHWLHFDNSDGTHAAIHIEESMAGLIIKKAVTTWAKATMKEHADEEQPEFYKKGGLRKKMTKAEMVEKLEYCRRERMKLCEWDVAGALEQALEHVPDDPVRENGFYPISYGEEQSLVRVRDGICTWLTHQHNSEISLIKMIKEIEWGEKIEFPEQEE